MSAEDLRYERDLKTSALTAIARRQQVVRRLEEDIRSKRRKLAELVCAATTRTPGSLIPYGRVEHVARLLGVKRDRIAKIRTAVRRSRTGRTPPPSEPATTAPSSLHTAA
ncbi:hypothetical protein [Streptomyces roseoverticillatus]|uniref:hypothetical protein n=1 Tax=Streptomyces roseoverticillatus TaxID=66429 RepID=UPI000ADF0400|nr:hypothetical protein [Streptomyces roseoverticillatus]